MIELEKEFDGRRNVKGFRFTQLAFNGLCYVYLVTDTVNPEHSFWYEVFRRREAKETDVVFNGVPVHYDARVVYPGDGEFGLTAKCCNSLEKAMYWYEKWSENGSD